MMDQEQAGSSSEAPLYRVTKVEDVFGPPVGLSGAPRFKRVTYTLHDDTASYVEVPFKDGWPDVAKAMIEQHIGDLLDVLALKGPVIS